MKIETINILFYYISKIESITKTCDGVPGMTDGNPFENDRDKYVSKQFSLSVSMSSKAGGSLGTIQKDINLGQDILVNEASDGDTMTTTKKTVTKQKGQVITSGGLNVPGFQINISSETKTNSSVNESSSKKSPCESQSWSNSSLEVFASETDHNSGSSPSSPNSSSSYCTSSPPNSPNNKDCLKYEVKVNSTTSKKEVTVANSGECKDNVTARRSAPKVP